ncbi:hypothetical protein D0T50_04055 [Bacteroides sp. 214]|uniref:hypothetical protein n=1 Tax=Bacteroides sp. 214 TaxID=2302935 RepID=UPI0013CF71DF|nr:hypothetical protein [Bacteroides sp. 214]NDW12061.1 hypothetical protein [Bacteroides sp. 214]
MAHHLNTNKQFMVGNGILAFGVFFIVAIFIYISLRFSRDRKEEEVFPETYTISLTKGFAGDSLSIFINDSLFVNKLITEEPFSFDAARFAEQSALMIVDNLTEKMSLFELNPKGGTISLMKDEDGVKLLAQ